VSGSRRRLGALQFACNPDPQVNRKQLEQGIREAGGAGLALLVLQELHNTVYFCSREDPALFDLAEPVPGPTTEHLAALAREHRMVIVGSVFEDRGAGVYHNTAIVLDSDGQMAGIYRKMHIPDDPGYFEKFYFTPGDLGFEPIDTSLGRLGVLVCWDQWFPEAARLMALAGAELLVYPSAIGWDRQDPDPEQQRQREAWITVQRGHAIANNLPLISCNRVGLETDPVSGLSAQFWGSSFVCGPQGEILAQAATDRPALIWAEVDLGKTAELRRLWPYLRDRRIDAYQDLLKRLRRP
jgi:N-carbamoylputrescine amidase